MDPPLGGKCLRRRRQGEQDGVGMPGTEAGPGSCNCGDIVKVGVGGQ